MRVVVELRWSCDSRCQLDSDWKGTVRVVSCDMREAKVDESDMADIVVSELLGSFGDNELSPECLDGAQKSGLMREDAVSIPQDYTSFIAPLSSSKLHQLDPGAPLLSNSTPPPSGTQRPGLGIAVSLTRCPRPFAIALLSPPPA